MRDRSYKEVYIKRTISNITLQEILILFIYEFAVICARAREKIGAKKRKL